MCHVGLGICATVKNPDCQESLISPMIGFIEMQTKLGRKSWICSSLASLNHLWKIRENYMHDLFRIYLQASLYIIWNKISELPLVVGDMSVYHFSNSRKYLLFWLAGKNGDILTINFRILVNWEINYYIKSYWRYIFAVRKNKQRMLLRIINCICSFYIYFRILPFILVL